MPNGMQILILWAILAGPENGLPQRNVRPVVSATDRDALVVAGLIRAQRRGRDVWLEATEKGWAFAQDHLDAPLPERAAAASVLQAWLTRLKTYLDARNLPLADLLSARPCVDLRAAYLAATGGALNQRLRLAALRAACRVDRGALDAALTAAHGRDGLHLSGSDNPPELTPEDHAAALDYKGERMHFVWIVQ